MHLLSFARFLFTSPIMHPEIEASVIGGRYVIDRKLGAGGEGSVYLAYDQLLKRHVAIKSVHTGNGALTNAEGAFNEAMRLASLQHPNIVTVFDFLPANESVFVVMEFINGDSLDRLAEPMDIRVFGDFARQCLEALAAAHSLGMVHRDIKSANIVITWTESGDLRVKLLDFGLAKVISAPSEQTLDHSGALTGSIYFLSPEQLGRQPIDHRADIYSLGCVFYRALTLRNAFQGAGIPEIITAHLQHDFVPLGAYRPDLPQGLTAWVEQLFSFSPNDRPASATAALEALERLKNTPALPNRTPSKPPAQRPPTQRKKGHRFPAILLSAVTLLLVGAIFLTMKFGGQSGRETTTLPMETEDESRIFQAGERNAIARRDGKTATVTGEIENFREEGSRRFLTFKGSESGDVALSFVNSEKGDFSTRLLKTFINEKAIATGVVSKDGKRLHLEVQNMSQLRRQVPSQIPKNSQTP